MTVKELNLLFRSRLPKGRSRDEIRSGTELRLGAKALALAVLRTTPKGPAQDAWIKKLRDDIETVYSDIDLAPLRVQPGN